MVSELGLLWFQNGCVVVSEVGLSCGVFKGVICFCSDLVRCGLASDWIYWGFRLALCGFRIVSCGFRVDLCGFRESLWGFRMASCGFRLGLWWFQSCFDVVSGWVCVVSDSVFLVLVWVSWGFRLFRCGFSVWLCFGFRLGLPWFRSLGLLWFQISFVVVAEWVCVIGLRLV